MNPAMILALIQASPELLSDFIVLLQDTTKVAISFQAFLSKVHENTRPAA